MSSKLPKLDESSRIRNIRGLIASCSQQLALLQLGRSFERDFGSSYLQLQWIDLRIRRWSKAAGFTAQSHEYEDFMKQFGVEDSQQEADLASDIWEQIWIQLQRAQEDSQEILRQESNPRDLTPLVEEDQLKACDARTSRAIWFLKQIRSSYQLPLKTDSRVVSQDKWILYERRQLKRLVMTISDQIETLELMFPEQEHTLAAAEVAAMDDDVWEALIPLARYSDPLLATALEEDNPDKGFSYENVRIIEGAKINNRHNYNQELPSQGPPMYRALNAGDIIQHDGNSYGSTPLWSKTLPEMQSTYGYNSPTRPDQSDLRSALYQLPTHQYDQVIAAKQEPGRVLRHEATQGAKGSPAQLELPQLLTDRSDVDDDGPHPPKGSVTASKTYGTSSMPFQSSVGFSSIGDAPTRELSSATGLETHGLTDRERGSMGPDCSDDEHAADTMSIHTDGRQHNLDPDTELSLAKTFAYHILEELTPQQLNDLFDQQDAIASIAELIGDFSVLLGANIADDDARSPAVVFVRHQRKVIANELASAAKAWRPSNEDQVSMEEKLKMLHFGDTDPTQYDDPNLEQDSAGSHEDEDQQGNFSAGNDTPELRNVVLGRDFVLGSEELPWMIDRIQRYESLLHTGKIFSSVRSGIARTIETNSEHLEFSLDWDILTTLNQQYDGESRSHICLSNMIVYNGTPSLCYASTTSEYVKQVWPAFGAAVVDCFDRALVSTDSMSTLDLQDSRLHIKLDGATTKIFLDTTTEKSTSQSRIHMLEAAEVCIWLAAACCANTHEELIGLNFPQLANMTGETTPPEFGGSVINDPSLDGQCWFKMVNNPVVASGYPIPKREDTSKQQGLEVSLGLMAALSHSDWVTNFGSKLLIKGTISALVPITEVGMSVVWHFLINANQESMSYHQACNIAIDTPHLTYSDLECRRHFVGIWAQSARILAGSNQNTIYDLYPSRSKPISHRTISLTGLSINGGKFLTVGTTFNIGKKDLAPALKASEARMYENHIADASNMTVLFYSSSDRRGWLLDGASALAHLARAWLTSKAAEHGTSEAIEQLHYTADNGERSSALKVLRANQEVKIFEDTTEVHETSIPVEPISEPDNPSTDSGYMSIVGSSSSEIKRSAKRTTSQWTYKSLVIDLWRNLEAMKAKLVQLKQHGPEVSVRLPSKSPMLTGWDVSDFLSGRTPLEPRFIKLKREGKAWNKFTKDIFSVPLMGESFHDLILPDPRSQVCQSASTLPAGRDLLAVPLSVLLLTASRFLRWQENLAREYARVTDHAFLVAAKHPEGHCRCSQDANCKTISGLTKKPIKGTRTGPSIFERCPHAMVIIGLPDTRRIWECKTQDGGSSTQAVPFVSGHHAASSPRSVGDTTSGSRSVSQYKRENLGGVAPSNSIADTKSAARSTSQDDRERLGGDASWSSIADTTFDARPASRDSHLDLNEAESNSLSGGSVYESCED